MNPQGKEGITNPALSDNLQSLSGGGFLGKSISTFIELALILGAIVTLFMLLIGGIQWMTSGGDKAGLEAAKGRITAALIGLLILFSAFAIIKLLETIFGIPLLGEITIPSI